MIRPVILLAMLLFIGSISFSQTVKKKVAFSSILQVGVLEGSAEKPAILLQTINGIKINSWYAGIGVGVDYYNKKRSVPLFFSVRKELVKRKVTPFVYADAGYNFSWLRNEEKSFSSDGYKEKGGAYYDVGVGYKFALKNKMALGLSTGYSVKKMEETYSYPFAAPRPSVGPQEQYQYTLRRFNVKISCWF